MIRLTVDPLDPDPGLVNEAAVALLAGGLVAFPTETVYGLGAHALDPHAVRRIYHAKGRPSFNPVIVHIATPAAAQALVTAWPVAAERLARAFWPGPLTLVLPRAPAVPSEVTAGLDAVGIRIPAHPVALALLRAAAVPVAAPSANRYTELSPTTADHVRHSLGDAVDVLLDGGPTTVGIESTVVDLTSGHPVLLRPGMISAGALSAVLGEPVLRAAHEPESDAPRRSPGQVERHYAPRAELAMLGAGEIAELHHAPDRVGLILRTATVHVPGAAAIRLPDDPHGFAHGLYAALHTLDEAGCTRILVEELPRDPAWDAIRDRLERASR